MLRQIKCGCRVQYSDRQCIMNADKGDVMGKIVAMGGGEIKQRETLELDRYAVELTGKSNPMVLFIPTASHDAGGYINIVKKVYHSLLGCAYSTLLFYLDHPDEQTVRDKIEAADLIYVGGGNTAEMMRVWREHGVDAQLKAAYERGCVMAGLSAGAICWFESGYSDSQSFGGGEGWEYEAVDGLGLVSACVCPHYNEPGRQGFDSFMQSSALSGISLDNRTAFCVDGDRFTVKRDGEQGQAYLLSGAESAAQKTLLAVNEWQPLSLLAR